MTKIKRNKKVVCLLLAITITICFGTTSFAFIYLSSGYESASIQIENRTITYSDQFIASKNAWNATSTPAWITAVAGSGNNWIDDDVYTDTWNGEYVPVTLQYVLFGRATKFHIRLNRSLLVNESSNFRRSVIVHELGHALCLNDNPSNTINTKNNSIMNYMRDRDVLISPTQDDIDGVNDAY